MGNCIGRCFCRCSFGNCCCCDCVIFKRSSINPNVFVRRRASKNDNKAQTFTLRRQSSSATIEFENLMFDFDLPVKLMNN